MKRLIKKNPKASPAVNTERITNDTVSEHRKRILAGGRKFKYPLQYSRHKLVINTIIITTLSLIAVGVFGWWQLYPQQNTGIFAYRVTSVLPLPVASVDGENVRYSDYLLKFRSAEHYLQQKERVTLSSEDGERQRAYLKQQALEDAVADAYALKLAAELDITVSDDELAAFLKSKRQVEGGEITERTHYAVIRDYYDWSPAEYERIMRTKLLRERAAFAIDKTAQEAVGRIEQLVADGDDSWRDIVESQSGYGGPELIYGTSGMVPKTNQDGGLAAAAAKLAEGQISDAIMSTAEEAYYYSIIRLIDSDETQVNYEFIRVPLTAFDSRVAALYQDEKVRIYIDIPRAEEEEA